MSPLDHLLHQFDMAALIGAYVHLKPDQRVAAALVGITDPTTTAIAVEYINSVLSTQHIAPLPDLDIAHALQVLVSNYAIMNHNPRDAWETEFLHFVSALILQTRADLPDVPIPGSAFAPLSLYRSSVLLGGDMLPVTALFLRRTKRAVEAADHGASGGAVFLDAAVLLCLLQTTMELGDKLNRDVSSAIDRAARELVYSLTVDLGGHAIWVEELEKTGPIVEGTRDCIEQVHKALSALAGDAIYVQRWRSRRSDRE